MKHLLVLFLLFIATTLCAQLGLKAHSSLLEVDDQTFEVPRLYFSTAIQKTQIDNTPLLTTYQFIAMEKQSTPSFYCYDDLAFFCKIEVQLEKIVQLPFKFRLGSVQYVDYLEGKNKFGDY